MSRSQELQEGNHHKVDEDTTKPHDGAGDSIPALPCTRTLENSKSAVSNSLKKKRVWANLWASTVCLIPDVHRLLVF